MKRKDGVYWCWFSWSVVWEAREWFHHHWWCFGTEVDATEEPIKVILCSPPPKPKEVL
jgi:hypothetical protein